MLFRHLAGFAMIAGVLLGCPPTPKPATIVGPQLRSLTTLLDSVVRQLNLQPVHPPMAGLKPGWLFEPNKRLVTNCIASVVDSFPSLDLTIQGRDSSSGKTSIGAPILRAIGINLSANSDDIRYVDLSLKNARQGIATNVSFQWTSGSCLQELESGALLVQTTLQFGTLTATATTEAGKRIALDSAGLARGDFKIQASSGWALSRKDTLHASGNDLTIGAAYVDLALLEHSCAPAPLAKGPLMDVACDPGETMRPLAERTEKKIAWYALALDSASGDSVVLSYTAKGPSGRDVKQARARLGQQVVLADLPRRVDLLVVDRRQDGLLATITRHDVVYRGTELWNRPGGAQSMHKSPPLPDTVASKPLDLQCQDSISFGIWKPCSFRVPARAP